jgi:GLPGLI family protein
MKKAIFAILSFGLFITSCFSQANSGLYEIEFLRKVEDVFMPGVFHESTYMLNRFLSENVSYFDKSNSLNNKTSETFIEDQENDAKLIFRPKGKNLRVVFKNYNSNRIYLKQMITLKFIAVEDSLDIFNWDIKNESKVILGFSCQKATTEFRGRVYEAWFTTELPVGGPWKYDGLPGMILSIHSLDNYISYLAVSLKTKNKEGLPVEIQNPFEEETFISWNEFKEIYKEKAISLSKYSTEGQDVNFVLPRMRIERYIEENDEDYKADIELKKQMGIQNN